MTLRAAAEQALDTLEHVQAHIGRYDPPVVTTIARAMQPTIDALRAALAAEQPQPEALGYATRLATSLWEKHYKAVSPHWRPLNDTLGVLTQIDNMTCRLVPPPPAAEPSDVTDAARYRWLRDHRGGEHAVVNGELLEGSELDENIDAALRAAAAARNSK